MVKKRILIVDDKPVPLETIQMNLEIEGYECLVAYDGFRGFERARKEKPDMIILAEVGAGYSSVQQSLLCGRRRNK